MKPNASALTRNLAFIAGAALLALTFATPSGASLGPWDEAYVQRTGGAAGRCPSDRGIRVRGSPTPGPVAPWCGCRTATRDGSTSRGSPRSSRDRQTCRAIRW